MAEAGVVLEGGDGALFVRPGDDEGFAGDGDVFVDVVFLVGEAGGFPEFGEGVGGGGVIGDGGGAQFEAVEDAVDDDGAPVFGEAGFEAAKDLFEFLARIDERLLAVVVAPEGIVAALFGC
jgi:hypothetical protein